MSSTSKIGIVLIALFLGAGFTYAVPVVPITYEESYQVQVPYEEQEPYTIQVPYNVQVPYTVQEPYTVTETYTEQEPYTVQVPYSVDVTVTKTHTIIERINAVYDQIALYSTDFSLSSTKTLSFQWSSDKQVLAFLIVDKDTSSLVTAAVLAVIGLVQQEAILGALASLAGNFKYYAVQSNSDSTILTLSNGNYKIMMVIINPPVTLNLSLSYDYDTIETQTRYRDETEYRTVTKTRDVIKYRTVTKYRTETRYRDEIRYRTVSKIRTETRTRDVTIRVTVLEYLSGNYLPT